MIIGLTERDDAQSAFAGLGRLVLLYFCLLAYEWTTFELLKRFIAPVYESMGYVYNADRTLAYMFVVLTAPLAALTAGTRINNPSQIIFAALSVLLLLTTPLHFVAKVPLTIFYPAYACIWISIAILGYCSNARFTHAIQPMSPANYRLLLAAMVGFFLVFAVYGATKNFQLVSFADIYKVRRGNAYVSDFIVRVVHMYLFSFGGLFLAMALARRSYFFALISIAGFVICYMESQLKAAVLGPAWIIYILLSRKYFFRDDLIKLYLTLAAPYFFGALLFMLFPESVRPLEGNPLIFAYTNVVNERLYSIPAMAFGVYYDFFQIHPVTQWSHISGINLFVHYPYGDKSIAEVLNDTYGLGNFNASFISMDAVGAYDFGALPLVSAVMGLVLILINSASRGLGRASFAVIMIMPAVLFLERPMATSLLTGGVIFLIPYLALMPRQGTMAETSA